ncbi:MAG: ribbon-helix-helix domain-containing protein [Terracidiphilus sp.]|jgi:hypothetical protein
MAATIQARLDEETQAALERLVRDNGWTASQAIRECIREAAERHTAKPRPRFIGVGEFDSGLGDLATNKKHMQSFGVKSMGKGWRPPKESVE